MKRSSLLAALAVWFVVALVLTLVAPPPAVGAAARFAIILGPVVLLTTIYAASQRFREALAAVPLRAFVAAHLVRAVVGVLFLVLGSRAQIPIDFAVPAGIGDIAAGVLALVLLLLPNWQRRGFALALMAWCLFGIADFVNVQRVVAQLQAQGRGAEFIAMNGPPLALVPYFGVPLLWFSHVVVLVRSAACLRIPPHLAPLER